MAEGGGPGPEAFSIKPAEAVKQPDKIGLSKPAEVSASLGTPLTPTRTEVSLNPARPPESALAPKGPLIPDSLPQGMKLDIAQAVATDTLRRINEQENPPESAPTPGRENNPAGTEQPATEGSEKDKIADGTRRLSEGLEDNVVSLITGDPDSGVTAEDIQNLAGDYTGANEKTGAKVHAWLGKHKALGMRAAAGTLALISAVSVLPNLAAADQIRTQYDRDTATADNREQTKLESADAAYRTAILKIANEHKGNPQKIKEEIAKLKKGTAGKAIDASGTGEQERIQAGGNARQAEINRRAQEARDWERGEERVKGNSKDIIRDSIFRKESSPESRQRGIERAGKNVLDMVLDRLL